MSASPGNPAAGPRRWVLARLGAPVEGPTPPLELLDLAAGLRELEDTGVALVDLQLGAWDPSGAARVLLATAPDAALLWAEPGSASDLAALTHHLRAASAGIVIVAAGPASLEHAGELLAEGRVEAVLRPGEGDGLVEGLRARRAGQPAWRGCRGLIWRSETGTIVSEGRASLPPLPDRAPLAAWDLIDLARYFRRPGRGPNRAHREWAPLRTTRACAPDCPLCRNAYGRAVRGRRAARVLEEVDLLVRRHGVRELVLEDDLANYDPHRLRAIAQGIRARGDGLVLTLARPLRADRIEAADAEALAAAGVRRCDLLVETGSPRLQRELRLNVDLAAAARGVAALGARGIATRGIFTLGWANESEAERRATVRFATRAPFHSVHFRPIEPSEALPAGRTTGPRGAPAPGTRAAEGTRGRRRATLRTWLHGPRLWRRARHWWTSLTRRSGGYFCLSSQSRY